MSDFKENENDYVSYQDVEPERHSDDLKPALTESVTEKTGFFELVYGTLFNPVETFTKVSHDPPLFQGFIIFLISVVLTSVSRTLLPQDMADVSPEVASVISQAGPLVAVFGAILALVFWFIQAGILQVIAELLGGRGTAVGVLTVLALAGIPGILSIPFHVAGYFLSESFLGSFLSIAGSLLSIVWWVIILILGIRQVHRLSTGKAVITVVAPLITFILVVIVMVIAMVAFIAPIVNSVQ